MTQRTSTACLVAALAVSIIGASCGRPPDATPASGAAQVASIGQTTVTFSSEPDPPKAGDNGILVAVKQADGTPITDARVTAVFSMPAMPSMNMPAMRSEATLEHQGAGVYRGLGQLSMSGTWNVAVAVSRGGLDLGSARFSVVAK
ncbi:MAG TPA: FixH family protein [Vicinamibacterales bacterium]|nr:FixH family protein [Vicinamibacterales bacterium]